VIVALIAGYTLVGFLGVVLSVPVAASDDGICLRF
jgi:predicted PurR-regulated permease PerM